MDLITEKERSMIVTAMCILDSLTKERLGFQFIMYLNPLMPNVPKKSLKNLAGNAA